MRRLNAILTGFLVLTFSLSGWGNVCTTMSSKADAHGMGRMMAGMTEHDAGSSSHSHRAPGTGTGTEHCQHATSCTSVTEAATIHRDAQLPLSAGHAVSPNESLPSSQSPDLEPPPPKA
jgi:hypothetical protein